MVENFLHDRHYLNRHKQLIPRRRGLLINKEHDMGKVKTAWQAEQEQQSIYNPTALNKHSIKPSAIQSKINDPYNLWDTDGHEPNAIDINNWADTHD